MVQDIHKIDMTATQMDTMVRVAPIAAKAGSEFLPSCVVLDCSYIGSGWSNIRITFIMLDGYQVISSRGECLDGNEQGNV